jgi:integrase
LDEVVQKLMNLGVNLHAEPTPDTLVRIQDALRNGVFGQPRTIRNTLRFFADHHIHPNIVACFGAVNLTQSQQNTLQKLRAAHKQPFGKNEFLTSLRAVPNVLDLNECARYCLVQSKACELRIRLLYVLGCTVPELMLREHIAKRQRLFLHATNLWRRCFPTKPARVAPYLRFVESCVPSDDPNLLFKQIRSCGTGHSFVLAMVCRDLQDAHRPDLAQSLCSLRANHAQRVQKLSAWHADLLNRFMQTCFKTSFPERRSASMKSQFAKFVLDLEQETGNLRDFVRDATTENLFQVVCAIVAKKPVKNERVKRAHDTHHAYTHAQQAVRFMRFLRPDCCLSAKDVARHVPNKRVPAHSLSRRGYTDDEMAKMSAAITDPGDDVMFALLQEIGLRNSALGHIRYSMFLDANHDVLQLVHVPEKGQKLRSFCLSARLREKVKHLSDFLRSEHDEAHLADAYLLNVHDIRKPLSSSTICKRVRAIAQQAGVTDVEVHPHAFRHTLVNKLVAAGNSMDIVSKFMGHSSVGTTNYFYWVPTPQQIGETLIDPFGAKYKETKSAETATEIFLEAANAKVRCCRSIIDLFMRKFPKETVLDTVPDLEALLRAIDVPLVLESEDAKHVQARRSAEDFVYQNQT